MNKEDGSSAADLDHQRIELGAAEIDSFEMSRKKDPVGSQHVERMELFEVPSFGRHGRARETFGSLRGAKGRSR
jgi:hypothetical protein